MTNDMRESGPDLNKTISLVKLCARIILENGGETYRAEDTVYRICTALGFDETDVLALPTGVFITVCRDGVNISTTVKRIRKRTVNLSAIDRVNEISRQVSGGSLSLDDALVRARAAGAPAYSSKLLLALCAGMSSGCLSLLFKGGPADFVMAALCGMIVQFAASSIKTVDMFNFAVSLFGGVVIGLGSITAMRFFGVASPDKIITGAMMPLLPGIAMTNAIRDTMRGDLVSGVARGAEALLVAAALAFGVGIVLKLYYMAV